MVSYSAKELKIRLKEKMSEDDLSFPKLEKLIGIPAARMYKWYEQDTTPKLEDAKKIEKYLNGDFDKVPHGTTAGEDQIDYTSKRFNHKMLVQTLMVPLVPIRAQAGYISSHELFDFIEKLEKFPMAPGINPRGAEWRWFEVAGDSMEPTLYEGDYVLASRVADEDWRNLEDFYLYVIVTGDRIWAKRVVKKNASQWVLHSDNKKVPQRLIDIEEVKELWKVRRHLNARMPPPEKIVVNV